MESIYFSNMWKSLPDDLGNYIIDIWSGKHHREKFAPTLSYIKELRYGFAEKIIPFMVQEEMEEMNQDELLYVNQVMNDCQCCDRHERNHPTNTDMMNGSFSYHDYPKHVCLIRYCKCPCRSISRCIFRQFWINKNNCFPEESYSMDSDIINLPTISQVEEWLHIDLEDYNESPESKEIFHLERDAELIEEEIDRLRDDYFEYGDNQDMKDAHSLGRDLKKIKETLKSLRFMQATNSLPDVCEDVLEDMTYISYHR